jgi:predicted enzyme related to lactoylglutathione lyase
MEAQRSPDTPFFVATTIDCHDLEGMTRFWAGLLGVEFQIHEPFGFLTHAPGRKTTIWLQRVPEEQVGKNRIHLDLAAADLEASLERVRGLGGEVGDRQDWQGYFWNTCADPEGNVFDIMQAPES